MQKFDKGNLYDSRGLPITSVLSAHGTQAIYNRKVPYDLKPTFSKILEDTNREDPRFRGLVKFIFQYFHQEASGRTLDAALEGACIARYLLGRAGEDNMKAVLDRTSDDGFLQSLQELKDALSLRLSENELRDYTRVIDVFQERFTQAMQDKGTRVGPKRSSDVNNCTAIPEENQSVASYGPVGPEDLE